MAFKGIRCPDPSKPDVVPGPECYECSLSNPLRKCPFPSWLIAATVPGFKDGDFEDWDETRESFSPTTLGGCKRQIALKRLYDYSLDPATVWVMVRGTAFHLMAEGSHRPEFVEREIKVTRQIYVAGNLAGDTIEVRGKVDEYNKLTHHLIDWKSVAYLGESMRENVRPDWTAQLSVYRWLLHPDRPVESAEIQMMDMRNLARRIYRLWPLDKTEEWIRSRAAILLDVYRADYLPPVLPPKEQWRCRTCPMAEICEEVE